jgi:tape measure domain-containing protein
MIVRELLTRLSFDVDQSKLKKYEQGTDNIKKKAEAAAVSFRNIFAAFAGVAAVRSLATIADSMQSLEARIGMLPQTMGDTASAFDEIAKHATDTRQSIEAYGTLYTRIGNAAKNYLTTQEDVLQVTDTISKALVVGGATAQESASVMTQFSQALGAGTLQGEEFRAMAEAAPQYLDALAVALGHPREQLKKLASEGKITTKDVIEATRKIANDFDEKFRQMPMTIGQATTIMGNKWGQFIARFNRESKVVTIVANFIVNGFDAISRGLDVFLDAVGGASNALSLLMIVFGSVIAMMIPGWLAVAAATIAANLPVLALLAAFILLGLILEDVYNWFVGNDSLLGDMIGHSSAWSAELEAVKEAFDGIMAVAGFLWENVLKPLGEFALWAFLQQLQILASVFRLILSTISGISSAIKAVGGFLGIGEEPKPLSEFPVNRGLKLSAETTSTDSSIQPNAAVEQQKPPFAAKLQDGVDGINAWRKNAIAQNQPQPNVVGVPAVAAAAVPPSATNITTHNEINISMPAGSPAETREAARLGVGDALGAQEKFARQSGQAQ